MAPDTLRLLRSSVCLDLLLMGSRSRWKSHGLRWRGVEMGEEGTRRRFGRIIKVMRIMVEVC